MNPVQLAILRTIRKLQPVLSTDLFRAGPNIKRDSFGYHLRVLHRKYLIHIANRDGPVWLTLRGSEVLDEI
jgi:hypothetical protein